MSDVLDVLTAYLADHRDDVVIPGGPEEVVGLLGLDDATLSKWSTRGGSLVSLPHASPNVFTPRTRVAWWARIMQAADPDAHHVRVVLPHVNLSDLGWRPYAWWTLDVNGAVHDHRVTSRNKKFKHVAVSSLPTLQISPSGLTQIDDEAVKAAAWGTDLSRSYMIMTAATERAAGLGIPGRTTYVPLDLLVAFVRDRARSHGSIARWARDLVEVAEGRRIDTDGRLKPSLADDAYVFDNAANIALLGVLGSSTVLGGSKMIGYWPDVEAVADQLSGDIPAPLLHPVPDLDPAVLPVDARLAEQLSAHGVRLSQAMAVTAFGKFADHVYEAYS